MLFDRKGADSRVNYSIDNYQSQVQVVTLADGGFLAVWHNGPNAWGPHESINYQRFDAAGMRVGAEVVLNTRLPEGASVDAPAVTALAGGGYAIAWRYSTSSGAATAVFKVRTFAADGTEVGTEDSVQGASSYDPALTALVGGGFALGWSANGVKAQLFDAAGAAVGTALSLKTGGFATSAPPAMATLSDGRVLVAWWDPTPTGGQRSGEIRARLFNPDGSPAGDEFLVNATIAADQSLPTATALAGGGFVIGWRSMDSGNADVRAQVYDSGGTAVGGEILVNTVTAGAQGAPDVAATANGGFIFTWTDFSSTREGTSSVSDSVWAQAFDAAGGKLGGEFLVNTTTRNSQQFSSIAALPSGDLVVMWTDHSQVDSGYSTWGTDIGVQILKPHVALTDISVAGSSVNEVAFNGTVVATFGSNAAVNGAVRYEIVSDPTGGAFAISGNQLVVASNVRFDFETLPQVQLVVRAVEFGGSSHEEAFSFTVTNSIGEMHFEPANAVVFHDPPKAGTTAGAGPVVRLESGLILTTYEERFSSAISHHGQFVDDAGQKIGGSFLLSTTASGGFGTVAALPGGGFVASWVTAATYVDGVYREGDSIVQRFDALGAPSGPSVVLDTASHQSSSAAKFASLSNGNLLAVWLDREPATNGAPLPKGQLFDPLGGKLGGEMVLPTQGADVTLASLPQGGFVLVWRTAGTGSPNFGDLKAQVFDNDFVPVGGEIQVSAALRAEQWDPSIAVLSSGNFVISWTDANGNGWDFSGASVRAQVFTPSGAKVGGEITVNTVTNDTQDRSQVTALPTGGFVVSWMDRSLYSSTTAPEEEIVNLKAQIFTETGARVGGEFQLNQQTQGTQRQPEVVAGTSGSFLAFWSDNAGVPLYNDYYVAMRAFRLISPGTAGADSLTGTEGRDILEALGGNDLLDGGAGADEMRGGTGDDVYIVDDQGDAVLEALSAGLDEVRTALADYALRPNVENLTGTAATGQSLVGNGLANVITGGAGNDSLIGSNASDFSNGNSGGVDTLKGGLGDDLYWVEGSDAVVENAGEGTDEVRTHGNYTLAADVENLRALSDLGQTLDGNGLGNIITGRGGVDTLRGMAGDDMLDGGAGNDVLEGGAGNDIYVVDGADTVTELAGQGTDEVRTALGSRSSAAQMYTLPAYVENLTGTSATGQGVHANALDNVVAMGAGGDLVVLDAGGADLVSGGGGDDFLYWGGAFTNADRADGGAGFDTLGLLGGYALAFDADDLASIEKLAVYSSGNQAAPNAYSLTMHDGNVGAGQRLMVVAQSLMANEVLTFNGSAELDGSFNVRGGRGSDTITGGAKADVIWGNLGADTLRGGAGGDTFEYRATGESTAAAADVIMDFAKGDRINLSAIDADGNAANGNSKFTWIGDGAFSGAGGELRVSLHPQHARTWIVEADTDGDTVADFTLYLFSPGGALPERSDFLL